MEGQSDERLDDARKARIAVDLFGKNFARQEHGALLSALAHLRLQGSRIPLHDGARLADWFDGLAELIGVLPFEDQRVAWIALVANDLSCRTGLPLALLAKPLIDRLRLMEKIES